MNPPTKEDQDRIVIDHLPLVRSIAIRVYKNLPVHVDLDDLIHSGVMGLMDAATKYDPEKKVVFHTYAKHRIKGAILDSLRQLDWASRDLRRRHKLMEEVTRHFTAEFGRAPSEEELAGKMGVEVDRWRQMVVELRTVGLISASGRGDERDEAPPEFPDRTDRFHPDAICAQKQRRQMLDSAMKTLPERYQQVVVLYYTNDMTMKEIGGILGINESRVSQIHKNALDKMATVLQGAGIHSSAAF